MSLSLAIVVATGCAGAHNDLRDPASKFSSVGANATVQHISGDLLGMRPDPITGMDSPAGVPYTQRVYDLGIEAEFWPEEPTMLGTAVGLLGGFHFGYLGGGEIDGMPASSGFLPGLVGTSFGTALQLLRRPGLLLALHSSLRLELGLAERFGDTAEAFLIVYGGVKAHYDLGPARTRLQYDFIPFWAGESRLEHRLTGLVSTRPSGGWGYGVRAALAVGQKRLKEGGLNDVAVTIGLEVQR
ncbi:MAG: hypothetical protein H0T46_34045 [Deltaproteobacteria bacterium]|nr:hypothetical protein [Deltaproteobacteria bacterium]